MKMRKKNIINLISVLLSLGLLLSLLPKLNSDASSEMVTMYVVSQIKRDDKSGDVSKLIYNKNGLLTKISMRDRTIRRKYKGKRIIEVSDSYSFTNNSYRYYYNSKDQVTKITHTVKGTMGNNKYVSNYVDTFKYDSKNRLKNHTEKETKNDSSGVHIRSWKQIFKYDKKNRIVKMKKTESGTGSIEIDTFTYDKTGNKISFVAKNGNNKLLMKATWSEYKRNKKGRVIWRKLYVSTPEFIKYKKIKVPKAYVDTVKQQQKAIVYDEITSYSICFNPLGYFF